MQILIYTDGGSLNNPGQAGIGFVVFNNDNHEEIYRHSEAVGIATNNQAEYQAVIKALNYVKNLITTNKNINITKIVLKSDSQLLVNQLNGLFKVKNPGIREYVFKIRTIEQEIDKPIVYINIPREQNKIADSLVKKATRSL